MGAGATYLQTVYGWLDRMGSPVPEQDHERPRAEALQWALARASRSGRCAYQFARDWVGRSRL